jgi:hypothetical protein
MEEQSVVSETEILQDRMLMDEIHNLVDTEDIPKTDSEVTV